MIPGLNRVKLETMKRIDFRQNKNIQTKATSQKWDKKMPHPGKADAAAEGPAQPLHGGAIFGLVSNMLMASKIAQAAKHHHLGVHNYDRAETLLEHARAKAPALIIMDWDGCEAQAFETLKKLRADEKLGKVPSVGFMSQSKGHLKEEAERAGCHRVYYKSDFPKLLDELMVRYAV